VSLSFAESGELRSAVEKLIGGDEASFRVEVIKLCEAGDVDAQLTYGRFLSQKAENAEAERWLKSAAKAGSVDAQYYLGGFYLQSKPIRAEEARIWLSAAASKGHKRAQALIAMLDKPAHIKDGKLYVKDILDNSVTLGKLKADDLSEKAIACYRHTRATYFPALDRAMLTCVEKTRTAWGKWIEPDKANTVGVSFARCVNQEMFQPKNMSYDDLIQCYKTTGP